MGTKLGSSTNLLISTVAEEHWRELIAWIDPMKDAFEVQAALREFQRRRQLQPHSPLPLEARHGGQRVAAATMVLLGARVAALAGIRGVDNHSSTAARLLQQLVSEVRSHGAVQVQAILDGTDSIATEIVEQAGFAPLAELQQLALMLRTDLSVYSPSEHIELPTGLRWEAVAQQSRARLTQLLAHTFIETLDCPALNGLRTADDVLEGFLDGQPLESQTHWWALASADKLLGCVLVNRLPDNAAELVYMGLGPTSRGRGYGKLLLDQGILAARQLHCSMFLAAVDCDNWPAIRLYLQAGFQEHARVQAWFHRAG